ncbi:MAG: hypothetical protein J0H83_18050 [Candidatus Melainabacteria bacterium]|nr:hypothetical protein [Candidatus Melainabacteria bacterium]
MIPNAIKKSHILKAINHIDRYGVPPKRAAHKLALMHNAKLYPPKYVISLAGFFYSGKELASKEFNSGRETISFLGSLGFTVVDKTDAPIARKTKRKHNERCKSCKHNFGKFLERIYGPVTFNPSLEITTTPINKTSAVRKVFEILADYRGFQNFMTKTDLPRSDYYLHETNQIVEFDESQHFTHPRLLSLLNYPKYLELGYDKNRWIKLCKSLDKRDNHPPHRDEQRAWLDTLRDFAPLLIGLRPTVRVCASDAVWCELSPNKNSDIEKFKKLINADKSLQAQQPDLGRIAIDGAWPGNLKAAGECLQAIARQWQGPPLKFLVTCGAFLHFPLPDDFSHLSESAQQHLLSKLAEQTTDFLLNNSLRKQLLKVTTYLTLGIDSIKKRSKSIFAIKETHSEMIVMVNLKTGEKFITGKCYPTPAQQNRIILFNNLESHFAKTEFGTVMLLGCHDLSIFSNRGNSTAREEWKVRTIKTMRRLAKQLRPTYVLQHPHTAVKTKTWSAQWREIERILPSVKGYISAGRYTDEDPGWGQKDEWPKVLNSTKFGITYDIILSKGKLSIFRNDFKRPSRINTQK